MVVDFDENIIEKFRVFSDLHMVIFVDSLKKDINENQYFDKNTWKEFNL
jgi:hypothetical protein